MSRTRYIQLVIRAHSKLVLRVAVCLLPYHLTTRLQRCSITAPTAPLPLLQLGLLKSVAELHARSSLPISERSETKSATASLAAAHASRRLSA